MQKWNEVFRTGTSAGMAKSRKGPKSGVWTEVAKMSPWRKQVILFMAKNYLGVENIKMVNKPILYLIGYEVRIGNCQDFFLTPHCLTSKYFKCKNKSTDSNSNIHSSFGGVIAHTDLYLSILFIV